jgi:hypothetical protein
MQPEFSSPRQNFVNDQEILFLCEDIGSRAAVTAEKLFSLQHSQSAEIS